MFNTTCVFQEIKNSQAKVIVLQGGTSSSKTISALQENIVYAIYNKSKVVTITGESIPNLKKGAYRDTEWLYSISPFFRSQVEFWNKSDRIIYFKNGSIIEFISNQTEQGAKAGKRDRLFADECNGLTWAIFFQMAIRTRDKIMCAYNPSAPFWAHEKLIGTTEASNDLSASVELIISDHRHNTFLSEEEHRKIEGIKDKDLWDVYARGRTGNLTGLIFPDWQMIPDDKFPWDNPFVGGLDFGYTNDPTAGVKRVKIADSIFLHELCYETALAPKTLKTIFEANGFNQSTPIYVEHDDDMFLSLRRLGLQAIKARKGQGSINAGILHLKQFKVFYTESSKNLHIEKTKYMWAKDKDSGESTNTPIDSYNHLIDSVRYAEFSSIGAGKY